MHKNFTSFIPKQFFRLFRHILVTTLLFSSTGIYSDDQTTSPVQAEPREVPAAANADSAVDNNTMAAQPREVGAASHDAAKAARAKRWQNIGIAGLAVAVAATAIYLASTNGGHHAKQ